MTQNLTSLDQAYHAMIQSPQDDSLRLRYYDGLADAVLFDLLEKEPKANKIDPKLFNLEGGGLVLAFDEEERLSSFAGSASIYAELPGRFIAASLAGQGVGLGVNLGQPSAMVLPSHAVAWLADTLKNTPSLAKARPISFHEPKNLPQNLVSGLKQKLARIGALADHALFAEVKYQGGIRGHLLAFVGAVSQAEPALAQTAVEALTFSGIDAGELDVTFLEVGDSAVDLLNKVALRFDWSKEQPVAQKPFPDKAPGSDSKKPPILC
jgi:hypothetical protein